MSVAAVNGVLAADVAAIDGVLAADVAAVDGVAFSGGGGGSATTWNSSENLGWTLSNGDLTAFFNAGGTKTVRANNAASTGDRYCEITIDAGVMDYFGLSRSDGSYTSSAYMVLMQSNGTKFTGGSTGAASGGGSTGGTSFTTGDVMSIYKKGTDVYLQKNGSYFGGQDPDTDTNPVWTGVSDSFTWRPCLFDSNTGTATVTLNCGAVAFTYTPPVGASAF